MKEREGKSLDKDIQKDEEIGCQYRRCQGKLKLIKSKFKECPEKFYRCNKNFRHLFVQVWDEFCSKPVYILFDF